MGGALKCRGGGSVGLGGGDAAGGESGRCRESGVGQECAQGNPDLLGWCVGGESDSGFELLDSTCVECLVASERQHQLRHAMGEGTQHGSQSAVADHRRAAGHEAIVVGEAHDLDAVGNPHGVAINCGGGGGGVGLRVGGGVGGGLWRGSGKRGGRGGRGRGRGGRAERGGRGGEGGKGEKGRRGGGAPRGRRKRRGRGGPDELPTIGGVGCAPLRRESPRGGREDYDMRGDLIAGPRVSTASRSRAATASVTRWINAT